MRAPTSFTGTERIGECGRCLDGYAITGGTAGDSHYLYDAEGNLLLQKGPSSTTLYLPGEQLTLNTTSGTVNGVRYCAQAPRAQQQMPQGHVSTHRPMPWRRPGSGTTPAPRASAASATTSRRQPPHH
ncbi:hypothetical protein OG762_06775 [Streptomyces sp. NBC_01136]|uniref:hypothetical protein n=1 Tax=unclassified Streptomyces TaxID=2593676 RepID=UPI00324816AE|nr:hypothetical protein OG762_06775 [Streptomyces sp. NBC_01136]